MATTLDPLLNDWLLRLLAGGGSDLHLSANAPPTAVLMARWQRWQKPALTGFKQGI